MAQPFSLHGGDQCGGHVVQARGTAPTHNAKDKSFKRHGSAQQNHEGRAMSQTQKLNNASAIKQQSVANMSQSGSVVGVYRNFWVIVEQKGGTMNREFGMQVAGNICIETVNARDRPYASGMKPLGASSTYCELGNGDTLTRLRSRRRNH